MGHAGELQRGSPVQPSSRVGAGTEPDPLSFPMSQDSFGLDLTGEEQVALGASLRKCQTSAPSCSIWRGKSGDIKAQSHSAAA